jgi:hypothetical protein
LLLNCTLVFAVMTSCFELYSIFTHTNPSFSVLGDDVGLTVGLKVLGDADGERVGLAWRWRFRRLLSWTVRCYACLESMGRGAPGG